MSDTYARVMRPADEPSKRRAARSGAGRGSGTAPSLTAAPSPTKRRPAGTRSRLPTPPGARRKRRSRPPRPPSARAAGVRPAATSSSRMCPRRNTWPRTPRPSPPPSSGTARTSPGAGWCCSTTRTARKAGAACSGWWHTSGPKWSQRSQLIRCSARSAGAGCPRRWTRRCRRFALPAAQVAEAITEGFGAKSDGSSRASSCGHPGPRRAPGTAARAAPTWRPSTCPRTSRPGVTACLLRRAWNRLARGLCGRRGKGERCGQGRPVWRGHPAARTS